MIFNKKGLAVQLILKVDPGDCLLTARGPKWDERI